MQAEPAGAGSGGDAARDALARARLARVARLATVTPGGHPHVVPLVFALVGAEPALRVYWAVDAKPKRSRSLQRVRNLQADPRAEVLIDGYEEDWSKLWWVRLTGSARQIEAPEEIAAALGALRAKYPQYRESPPPGPVFAIDVERVASWETAAPPGPPA